MLFKSSLQTNHFSKPGLYQDEARKGRVTTTYGGFPSKQSKCKRKRAKRSCCFARIAHRWLRIDVKVQPHESNSQSRANTTKQLMTSSYWTKGVLALRPSSYGSCDAHVERVSKKLGVLPAFGRLASQPS